MLERERRDAALVEWGQPFQAKASAVRRAKSKQVRLWCNLLSPLVLLQSRMDIFDKGKR